MNLLIPNLGSTSLKYQILEMPSERVLAKGRLERVTNYRDAIAQISTWRPRRSMRWRSRRCTPARATAARLWWTTDVVEALRQFLPAAPAHNAIYLTAIEAFREAMPGVPLVAAFEPEFHATMPEYARLYGVPGAWLEDGVEKYGFHGASHQYVAERVAAMLGRQVQAGELPPGRKLVDVRHRSGRVSTPRWGSRRNRVWRTPRGTATWTCSPCST